MRHVFLFIFCSISPEITVYAMFLDETSWLCFAPLTKLNAYHHRPSFSYYLDLENLKLGFQHIGTSPVLKGCLVRKAIFEDTLFA